MTVETVGDSDSVSNTKQEFSVSSSDANGVVPERNANVAASKSKIFIVRSRAADRSSSSSVQQTGRRPKRSITVHNPYCDLRPVPIHANNRISRHFSAYVINFLRRIFGFISRA